MFDEVLEYMHRARQMLLNLELTADDVLADLDDEGSLVAHRRQLGEALTGVDHAERVDVPIVLALHHEFLLQTHEEPMLSVDLLHHTNLLDILG